MVYWDDSTLRYYVGPASDLDYLVQLMHDTDEDVARDAYSHWCAGTSHGDGYETEQEAIAAAARETAKTRFVVMTEPSAGLAILGLGDSITAAVADARVNCGGLSAANAVYEVGSELAAQLEEMGDDPGLSARVHNEGTQCAVSREIFE